MGYGLGSPDGPETYDVGYWASRNTRKHHAPKPSHPTDVGEIEIIGRIVALPIILPIAILDTMLPLSGGSRNPGEGSP
jgi:hypothetical protein